MKRWDISKFLQSNEELEVWIFRDLIYDLSIGASNFCLDDQRTKNHPARFGRGTLAIIGKILAIGFFGFLPRHNGREFDLAIVG